jgi:hypothetical protein
LVGADLLIADRAGWSPEELVNIILHEGVTKVIGADPLVHALDKVSQCQADQLFRLRELFFSDEHLTRHGQALLHDKFDVQIKHYWRNRSGALGGFVCGVPEPFPANQGMRARPLFSYTASPGGSDYSESALLLNATGISRLSH